MRSSLPHSFFLFCLHFLKLFISPYFYKILIPIFAKLSLSSILHSPINAVIYFFKTNIYIEHLKKKKKRPYVFNFHKFKIFEINSF